MARPGLEENAAAHRQYQCASGATISVRQGIGRSIRRLVGGPAGRHSPRHLRVRPTTSRRRVLGSAATRELGT